jgi:hypothetical protein
MGGTGESLRRWPKATRPLHKLHGGITESHRHLHADNRARPPYVGAPNRHAETPSIAA